MRQEGVAPGIAVEVEHALVGADEDVVAPVAGRRPDPGDLVSGHDIPLGSWLVHSPFDDSGQANQPSMSLVNGRPAESASTWWPMPAPIRKASWCGTALLFSIPRIALPSWPQPTASTLPSKARLTTDRNSARSSYVSFGTASMSPSRNSRPPNFATSAATELRASTITSRFGPRRTRAASDRGITAAPRLEPVFISAAVSSL